MAHVIAQQSPSLSLYQPELSSAERQSRSRLRAFFSRKKPDKPNKDVVLSEVKTSTLRPTPTTLDPPFLSPPPPPPPVPPPKTPVVKRARSITWSSRARSKSAQRTPKVVTPQPSQRFGPLSFIDAYSQAILHTTVDVPAATGGRKDHNRRISVTSDLVAAAEHAFSRTPKRRNAPEDEAGLRHKGSWYTPSQSLLPKIFMMLANGYILQYSPDGSNERPPEKILELGPDSTAMASDAFPSKHWVLRISATGHSSDDNLPDQTPKSTWSGRNVREDNKPEIADFLLVFDTARTFDTWLTTIRRHIDILGGLDSRAVNIPVTKEQRYHEPLQKFQTMPEPKRLSQSYSHIPKPPYGAPLSLDPSDFPQPQLHQQHNPTSARSVGGSSGRTSTSLEKRRNPSISDMPSLATTPGTSVDGSAVSNASESPANDSFPTELMPKPLTTNTGSGNFPEPESKIPRKLDPPRTTVSKAAARKSSSVDPTMLWSYGKAQKNLQYDDMGEIPEAASPTKGIDPELFSTPFPDNKPQVIPEIITPPEVIQQNYVVPTVDGGPSKTIAVRRAERRASEVDSSTSRPTSTVAPLPTPGVIRKTPRFRRDTTNNTGSDVPSFSMPRPATSHDRTTTFSLFPKRNSSLEQLAKTLPSPVFSPSLSTFHTPSEKPIATENAFPFPPSAPPSARSEDGTMKRPKSAHSSLAPINTSGHHALGDDLRQSQRSPIVKDMHFASNFGTRSNVSLNQRLTDASRWSKSTVELPVTILTPPMEPGPMHRRLSPQKSMPNVVFGAGPALGPPPSGPLPPIPSISSTPSPRIAFQGRPSGPIQGHQPMKSSLSSHRSPSIDSVVRPSGPRHIRGASSISSVASVSTIGTATASPNKSSDKPARKLSSVSSVGSLGSVSGWMAASGGTGGIINQVPPPPLASPTYPVSAHPQSQPYQTMTQPQSVFHAEALGIAIDPTGPTRRPSHSKRTRRKQSEPSNLPIEYQNYPPPTQDLPLPPLSGPPSGPPPGPPPPPPSSSQQQYQQQQQQYRHRQSESRHHRRGSSRTRSWSSNISHSDRRDGPDGDPGNMGTFF